MIPTGRDFGLAEWIKIPHKFYVVENNIDLKYDDFFWPRLVFWKSRMSKKFLLQYEIHSQFNLF